MTTPPPSGTPVPPGSAQPPAYVAAPGYAPPSGYPPPGHVPPQGGHLPQGGYQVPPYGMAPPPYGYQLEPTSPGGAPLATFEKRLVARLIDAAILGGIGLVLIVPLYLGVFFTLVDANPQTADEGVTFLVTLLVLMLVVSVVSLGMNYIYNVEMALRRGGQTIGKRVAKVRIVPLDPAQTLTRRHLALRVLAEIGLGFVPAMSWVDGLWQLWDKPYRQCLHDKAAKTVVVRLDQ